MGEELTGARLDAMDLLRAGAISFSLTVVNIACIIVVAMIMFKVKEVAPIKGKSLLFQKNVRRRMEHQYRATMADPRLARAVRLVRATRGGPSMPLCLGDKVVHVVPRGAADGEPPTRHAGGGYRWHQHVAARERKDRPRCVANRRCHLRVFVAVTVGRCRSCRSDALRHRSVRARAGSVFSVFNLPTPAAVLDDGLRRRSTGSPNAGARPMPRR